MADPQTETSPASSLGDRSKDFLCAVFLELLGAPPAYDAWEELRAGKTKTAALYYGIAALPCILGLIILSSAWPRTRNRIGKWLATWFYPVIARSESWVVLFLLIFVYMATPILVEQIKSMLVVTIDPKSIGSIAQTLSPHQVSEREIAVTHDSGTSLVCPPIRSAPTRQISVEESLAFIEGFRGIAGNCPILVTAPPENDGLKNMLLELFEFPIRVTQSRGGGTFSFVPNRAQGFSDNGGNFAGFNLEEPITVASPIADADAMSTPKPLPILPHGEIIVHAPDSVANANVVSDLLTNMGLNAIRGHKYPADAPSVPGLVYVQIGSGSVWK